MPAVSIITPVYNAEKYIRQAIESVLSQTFTDWELIIVNDGSTDNSNKICHHYAETDNRIRIISKPNGGVSSARNSALDVADGEYIFFLDADDELVSYTIAHLIDVISKTDADIVIGQKLYLRYKPDIHIQRKCKTAITDAYQLCRNILYQKPHTDNGPWAKLYHKSLFDELRFYNGWFEDLEIFYKLLFRAKKIAVTDSVVYFYRKHPESFINSWSEGRKEIVVVTENIVNQMKADHPALVKAAEHRHFSASYNLLIALINNKPDDKAAIDKSFAIIKSLRKQIISDTDSRIKNRVGALASCLGLKFLSKVIKWTTK